MRTVGLLLSFALCLAGCKSKGEADAVGADPAALKAQQELVARRDALMNERKKLETERDQLDAKIKEVSAANGDTTELIKQREVIETKLETQTTDLTTISTKLDQAATGGNDAVAVAAREAKVASREQTFAEREQRIAAREREIAQRERDLAQREKETCGGGGTTIVQVPMPKGGGSYSRRDIDPLLQRARNLMSSKGLLPSDLGPAAGLESEATTAMKNDDWGKAYLAAAQLAATVDAIKVDKNFISAKTARLQSHVKSTKRDEATQQKLAEGMKDVMQKFGDGEFAAANKKLNALWAAVR